MALKRFWSYDSGESGDTFGELTGNSEIRPSFSVYGEIFQNLVRFFYHEQEVLVPAICFFNLLIWQEFSEARDCMVVNSSE